MTEQSSTLSMHYDQAQNYDCRECPAKCCRFPWDIKVLPAEYERYQATPWIQERLHQHKVTFIQAEEVYRLPRVKQADGGYGCVFLDEDNLCSMQKSEGHAFIPTTCQAFPFAFVEDKQPEKPSAIFPAVSYFCPSIVQNYGDPMAPRLQGKYQEHEAAHQVVTLPEFISFNQAQMPKQTYLQLADWVQSLFEQDDLPVVQAFLRVRRALSLLAEKTASQPAIDTTVLQAAIKAANKAGLTPLPEVSRNTLTGRVITSIILTPLAVLSKCDSSKNTSQDDAGWDTRINRLLLSVQLIRETGQLSLWKLPRPVDLQLAKAVRIDETEPAFQANLKRYYRELFRQKMILTSGQDFMKLFFILGGSYAAILRLARYIAYAHGRQAVALEDLQEAIGYSMLLVVHQPQLKHNMTEQAKKVILETLSQAEDTFERVLLCES